MVKNFSDRILVSIDVGTTKICVLVAQIFDSDHFEIIGVGKAPSDGLKKGVVVDIGKTIHSVKAAIKEAELMAGISITHASVGVSGGHIKSTNSHGVVPIKHGEVGETDVHNVLAAARAIPIPEGMQILHVLPQFFVIDSHERVHNPVGMHGIRLEVQAHIIMGAIASVQNLIKCVEMAGVKVSDIILEQLASAHAVLSDDERTIGVSVLDVGGGTSDFAVYQHSSIRHTMVLPVAGNHFTNDLAVGLRTTIKDAERIKKEQGVAKTSLVTHDNFIEAAMVQGDGAQLVQLSQIAEILQPRAQEIFVLIHEEIVKHRLQGFMPSGLVLTGGGSLLTGMKELAEEILQVPVRIGMPRLNYRLPESLESPIYATGYGLLIHTLKQQGAPLQDDMTAPVVKRIFNRMKSWVADFF